jgi:hypothetical protein
VQGKKAENPSAARNITTSLNSLRIEGTALFHLGEFEATPGVFLLNIGTVSSTFSFAAQEGATPTPEPATMLLLGSSLVAAGVFARKRMQS